MSDEKLIVTKSKLDALATSISTKSGVATPMTIAQMKAAVDNLACGTITQDADGYLVISGEGDATPRWTADEIAVRNFTDSIILTTPLSVAQSAFHGSNIVSVQSNEIIVLNNSYPFADCKNLTTVNFPNTTNLSGKYAFSGCSSLTTVNMKKADAGGGGWTFRYCTNLETISLPVSGVSSEAFGYCSKLYAIDLGGNIVGSNTFINDTLLTTLILRKNSVCSLANINAFTGTPFASGGTGGTLYVPSALISSYQSATNWSTILGYTNNQILPIEGSIYETQYADGTSISS